MQLFVFGKICVWTNNLFGILVTLLVTLRKAHPLEELLNPLLS